MSSGGQTGTLIVTGSATALTAAIIEARVRQITRRDNTIDLTADEIAAYTHEACREISKRLLNIESSASGTLSASTNTITAPSDMVDCEAAVDDLYLDSTVLDKLTFGEWRLGTLRGYAYRAGTIYVVPTPDNDKTYTLYYRRYHVTVTSVTTLEFNEEVKMAIVYLVAQKIYDDMEQPDEAERMRQKFELELTKHAPCEMAVGRVRQHTRE